eukprot:jgi/Mesen1/7127/ME000369S06451
MAALAAAIERYVNSASAQWTEKDRKFLEELNMHMIVIKHVAEALEHENKHSKVEELEKSLLELIALENEVKHHRAALHSLPQHYKFEEKETNFAEMLQQGARQSAAQAPSIPEEHELYKSFKSDIWNVHHAGEPMPGQEEDDMVMTTSGLVLNVSCPISGKQVTDLVDPVRSTECRHIYDRASIIDFIRKRRGKKCPIAACPKAIVEEMLEAGRALKLELEQMKRRAGHSQGPNVECTDLDDD